MTMPKAPKRPTLFAVFDILKYVGILLLVLMFINFNAKLANQAKVTKDVAANTNTVVKGQNDILDAIKRLALDSKLTSDQKTNTIICMLQVPISQRTTDTQEQCKKQSEIIPTEQLHSASTPSQTTSTTTTNTTTNNSSTTNTQTVPPKSSDNSFSERLGGALQGILQVVGL